MELSETQIEDIEQALKQLEELDPAELPEPATQLAQILNQILEDLESA